MIDVIIINDILSWFAHKLGHMSQTTRHNKLHHNINNGINYPTLKDYIKIWFSDESVYIWLFLMILLFYRNKGKLCVSLFYFTFIMFLHYLFHTDYKLGNLYEIIKVNHRKHHDTHKGRYSLGILFGILGI